MGHSSVGSTIEAQNEADSEAGTHSQDTMCTRYARFES